MNIYNPCCSFNAEVVLGNYTPKASNSGEKTETAPEIFLRFFKKISLEKASRREIIYNLIRPNDINYKKITRIASEIYCETLGLKLATKAPFFAFISDQNDKFLGGAAINPVENRMSYPQIFFGDDIFTINNLDQKKTCEIGSWAIEAKSREWLPAYLFRHMAESALEIGMTNGIMIANNMVIKWLKKLDIEIHEIGQPDIKNPNVIRKLVEFMSWKHKDVEDWQRAYFDKLRPKIISLDAWHVKLVLDNLLQEKFNLKYA